ncbi:MAG: MotA/TolQ/ExbB proton channel family protein [Akkermansiaceae bacterium]|nr:MotA/TolQ/ExbB proton channel family protein [Akkermansiaceae bacterium]
MSLYNAIQQCLHEGGITLCCLLILAVAIYATLFKMWLMLGDTRREVASGKWMRIKRVDQALPWKQQLPSRREIQRSYASMELDQMARIERRLPFLAVLVSAAPLIGLMGTVAGMLITFTGMALGNAAPIDTVSTGISKALVTTQAGLVVAIPAAFLLGLLQRRARTVHLELQQQLHAKLGEIVPPPAQTGLPPTQAGPSPGQTVSPPAQAGTIQTP